MLSCYTLEVTLQSSEFCFAGDLTYFYCSIHLFFHTDAYLWFVLCLVFFTGSLESNDGVPRNKCGSYQYLVVKVLPPGLQFCDTELLVLVKIHLMLLFGIICAGLDLKD